jgi:hypothetical protein
VASVISVALFPVSRPPRLGALNLYARTAGTLADADTQVAVVLAMHLATALSALTRAETDRDAAANLRQALTSGT